MSALRRIAVAWLFGAVALASMPCAALERVGVILSESGGAYAELAEALRGELDGVAEVRIGLASEPERSAGEPLAAIVAVGTSACEHLAQSRLAAPSMLCVLLPKLAFDRIAHASRRRLAAIVLDQPFARQLALIRLALPGRARVAVLLGPQSRAFAAEISSAAAANQMQIVAGAVDDAENIGTALQRTLPEADVLLGVPDTLVFNGQTIQNILRTTFRMHVPLVAFSPAYVRAGALIAVYSTPAQIGRQAGQALRAALAGRTALSALQYPHRFMVASNRYVARSLGIGLPDEAALQKTLEAEQRMAEAAR